MAFDASALSPIYMGGKGGQKVWSFITTDDPLTVASEGYFVLEDVPVQAGDFFIIAHVDDVNAPSTATSISISCVTRVENKVAAINNQSGGDLLASNNLSDLVDATLAKANLGIPLNKYDATQPPEATNDSSEGYSAGSEYAVPSLSEVYLCLDPTENNAVWLKTSSVSTVIKNTYDATSAPTVNHDSTQGYSVGSKLLDTANDHLWICFDATEGAADWRKVSGTFAGLDELPDNSVTSGKVANGSITSDKLADNIRISGTFGIGDSYPVYVYRTSGGADTDWKNIADITIDTGAYAAVSLQVEVINPHSNFGSKVDLDRHIFTVSARRSGATQDSYNDGLIAGPYADWVRLVKTSTGVYQLQVRQYANNKHIEFSCKVTSLLKANVSYNKSPSNGSTTGDIYTVTEPDPYHGSSLNTLQKVTAAVNFNGTGTVSIRDSFNIQSITDLGTGRYRVNFSTAMDNENYITQITVSESIGYSPTPRIISQTTTYVEFDIYADNLGNTDRDIIAVSVFGGTT